MPTFGNPSAPGRRPEAHVDLRSPRGRRLLAAATVVACSASAPAAGPIGSPRPSPVGAAHAAAVVGIVHPTGATDVVLRFDEAGGFVPVEFLAAHVPYFTLYGDGTVVFVQASTAG